MHVVDNLYVNIISIQIAFVTTFHLHHLTTLLSKDWSYQNLGFPSLSYWAHFHLGILLLYHKHLRRGLGRCLLVGCIQTAGIEAFGIEVVGIGVAVLVLEGEPIVE